MVRGPDPMNVFCQKCKKNKASVQYTELENGVKVELQLCEECAEQHGLPPKFPAHTMIDFLQQFVEKSSPPGKGGDRQCPQCGMTFSEFKASGRFGCPGDYQVFGSRLIPLLERIHGASEHVPEHATAAEGTGPLTVDESSEKTELRRLRLELRRVVESEEYEKAAEIRDRIQELERQLSGGGASDG